MKLAVIGGSGLTNYPGLVIRESKLINTPFGSPSAPIKVGTLNGVEVMFLPRHGEQHAVPPHKINYRANLFALHRLQATHVLAVAAVGGITSECGPSKLVVPDQIIDYTYGREHSYFSDDFSPDKHIDFTFPYSEIVRGWLVDAALAERINPVTSAVYGATQGPRLETLAEIERMRRDGCDIVGMTGMPEAVLAKELGVEYATLAIVSNWAAGIGNAKETLSMQEIEATLAAGMYQVQNLIARVVTFL